MKFNKHIQKKVKGFILLDTMYALSIISISIVIGLMTFNNLLKKESLISSFKTAQQLKAKMINSDVKYDNIFLEEEVFEDSDFLLKKIVSIKRGTKEKQIESIVINWNEN